MCEVRKYKIKKSQNPEFPDLWSLAAHSENWLERATTAGNKFYDEVIILQFNNAKRFEERCDTSDVIYFTPPPLAMLERTWLLSDKMVP